MQQTARKRGMTIMPKILLVSVVISLLPLGGLWYMNYQQNAHDIQQHVERSFEQTLDALANKISGWLDMQVRALQQNAETADIQSMDAARARPLLESMQRAYPWASTAAISGPDGMDIVRSDQEKLLNLKDRQWFQHVQQGLPVAHEVVLSRTTGKPSLILSVPVKMPERAAVGVLRFTSNLSDISQAVIDVRIGSTGHVFLVDASGKLIAHGDTTKVSQDLQDMREHPAVKGGVGQQIVYTEDGKSILAKAHNLRFGWRLVVHQDYDEAFASLWEARHNALTVLVAAVGIALLLAWLVARGLSRPIRQLTEVADIYSRGELEATIPGLTRGDEIGALARAVDRLGFSFKMAMKQLS